MAQKIDSASGYDAQKMISLVSVIPDESNRLMAFEVGMAGFVQQSISTEGYSYAYAQCERLNGIYYDSCLKSVAWALFEHGDPQREYEKSLQLCADPQVESRGKAAFCYERIAEALPRFYTEDKVLSICRQFPAAYQSVCRDHSKK